ncbi:hypothetical protein BGZ94_008917 [Podila epigama]|nr:hypothetical protein BGZ94_008917 [Podila epigama]
MVHFRVAELDEANGHCLIGLLPPASLTLILYDIFISSWLTMLFIRPLMSSTSMLQGPSKGKLRDVARRTLLGSVVALLLSSANVFTLVYFEGRERGLICLASCTADVTLNAITIHWVTNRGGGKSLGTERTTGEHRHRSRSGGPGAYNMSEKQVAPADSHLSITVESYVEQYHQLHYGTSSNQNYCGDGGSSSSNPYASNNGFAHPS